jgi:hypothetical protein
MIEELMHSRRGTRIDEQLTEALRNIWFQGLILGVLAIGIPLLAGFTLTLLNWVVLMGITLVAWGFGGAYTQFSDGIDRPRSRRL